MSKLEELKQEATELGLSFPQNIGADKLQAKIDEYYVSQETSGNSILEAVKQQEAMTQTSAVKDNVVVGGGNHMGEYVKNAEALATKTRIITITDNDQRENNQTTVAVVNCSNEYFDLGTVYLPLNLPVEVRQGHINVLSETEIPLHVKDPKTGLSTLAMRKRYSISYEDK